MTDLRNGRFPSSTTRKPGRRRRRRRDSTRPITLDRERKVASSMREKPRSLIFFAIFLIFLFTPCRRLPIRATIGCDQRGLEPRTGSLETRSGRSASDYKPEHQISATGSPI